MAKVRENGVVEWSMLDRMIALTFALAVPLMGWSLAETMRLGRSVSAILEVQSMVTQRLIVVETQAGGAAPRAELTQFISELRGVVNQMYSAASDTRIIAVRLEEKVAIMNDAVVRLNLQLGELDKRLRTLEMNNASQRDGH